MFQPAMPPVVTLPAQPEQLPFLPSDEPFPANQSISSTSAAPFNEPSVFQPPMPPVGTFPAQPEQPPFLPSDEPSSANQLSSSSSAAPVNEPSVSQPSMPPVETLPAPPEHFFPQESLRTSASDFGLPNSDELPNRVPQDQLAYPFSPFNPGLPPSLLNLNVSGPSWQVQSTSTSPHSASHGGPHPLSRISTSSRSSFSHSPSAGSGSDSEGFGSRTRASFQPSLHREMSARILAMRSISNPELSPTEAFT